MKKPYTMPDGKTRSAATGPVIEKSKINEFLDFCKSKCLPVRTKTSLSVSGYDVRYDGHWMGLCWNSSFKRYTADRRLENLLNQFHSSMTDADPRAQ